MKIRMDFVTNSSSSSFILARKGELTEEQKNAVMEYIVDKMLGKKILAPDSTEERIQEAIEDEYGVETYQEEIREALKSGKSVYFGMIDHEQAEWHYCDLFEDIWKILEEKGHGDFEAIDVDLSY